MKRNYLFLNLALIAGLITIVFFGFYNKPKEVAITESEPIPVETINKIRELPKPVVHTGIDWDSINERLNSSAQSEGFTIEEEEAFNKLHVLPLNWVDQYDCNPNGNLECEIIFKYPPNAYETLDKAELFELAYADPLAALMMGIRKSEDIAENASWGVRGPAEEERISWFLRAAALSGKTGPLMRLIGEAGMTTVYDRFAVPPLPEQTIALMHVAERLGDPRADWKGALDAEVARRKNQPAEHVEDFKKGSDSWYQLYMGTMDAVQNDVTGSGQVTEFAIVGGDK